MKADCMTDKFAYSILFKTIVFLYLQTFIFNFFNSINTIRNIYAREKKISIIIGEIKDINTIDLIYNQYIKVKKIGEENDKKPFKIIIQKLISK